MKAKSSLARLVVWIALGIVPTVPADDLKPIQLVKPQTDGGRPLMQALKDRQTSRAFSPKPLTDPLLSNLMWAACGINRPDTGKRTAPSAVNWQEIDLYVAMPDGVYVYQAKEHALKPVVAGDLRGSAGTQAFVKDAPVVLIYVADRSRMGKASETDRDFYAAVDTGYISQNVYLFCASEGLATVVIGLVDRGDLGKKLNLGPEQRVILTQPVGYPP